MFTHQLCFMCFFRCCWTPAEQQPAVQIQLHHRGAGGRDQGVQRGQCWLQDLERCGCPPRVERAEQQRWPTDSTGGMSVQSYVETGHDVILRVWIIHIFRMTLESTGKSLHASFSSEKLSTCCQRTKRMHCNTLLFQVINLSFLDL